MSRPTAMKAITILGNNTKVSSVPVPQLRPTYLLAKVESIALNPTDWKHISNRLAPANSISGCDFAGTVVEVGSDVTKSLKPGDRIAGVTHGANFSQPDAGSFAEYCLAKADLVVKIPDQMSFDKASTFPLGVSTVGQGLFQKALKMRLPLPNGEPAVTSKETVLIYGGSTATGSLAIQYAKLAGYTVATTCSARSFDFVKSLGADSVYDYNDPDCGKKIRQDTKGSLKLAWDTISQSSSAAICAEALSSDPAGCKYGTLLPVQLPREGVEQTMTLMYTIFNEPFNKGGQEFPASADDFEFAKKFFSLTEQLVADGRLRTHPELVSDGGLEGMLHAMLRMKDGNISGQKLVSHVNETPEGSSYEIEL